MKGIQGQRGIAKGIISSIMGIFSALAMGNAQAAERVNLRMGPFQQEIPVQALAHYAETGDVPPSLDLLKPLLTPKVQALLTRRLALDEEVVNRLIRGSLGTRELEPLMEQLQTALPEADSVALMAALYLAFQDGDGLSAIDFIQAYPEETLTIDATATMALGVQLNLSYLHSQLLAPILEQTLKPEFPNSFRPPFDPTASGNNSFQERTLIFRDHQRDRSIMADFYLPNTSSGPLVVLSHGYASNRQFLTYLAQHLASHGLTVVALEHPGSNLEILSDTEFPLNPGKLLSPQELVHRPQDIRFLLDELSQFNNNSQFFQPLNTENVTVIGHSLGGYTALALAGGELDLKAVRRFCRQVKPLGRSPADWLQCAAAKLSHSTLSLRDSRITRAIALNPMTSQLFGEDGLKQVKIPTLIFSSSKDAVTPALTNQLQPFTELSGEKYLLAAIGATHLSVTDIRNVNSPMGKNSLIPELMGQKAKPVRDWIRAATLAFIKQEPPQARQYEPFLTPEYAQLISTPKLSFRLTQEMPRRLMPWLQGINWSRKQLLARENPGRDRSSQAQIEFNFPNLWTKPATHQYCQGQLQEIFTDLSRRLG